MTRPAALSFLLLLASCGYGDSRLAHQAQMDMQGMTAVDLQSCVGIPDKTKQIDARTEIFSYAAKNDAGTGVQISLPIIGGDTTIGGGGNTCTANFRLTDGRVSGLFYSGNNDLALGQDGVCSVIVRGCMRRPLPSMTASGNASAFRQPPAPAVPPPPPAPPEPVVIRMEPVGR